MNYKWNDEIQTTYLGKLWVSFGMVLTGIYGTLFGLILVAFRTWPIGIIIYLLLRK